jgi:hypothetical protein
MRKNYSRKDSIVDGIYMKLKGKGYTKKQISAMSSTHLVALYAKCYPKAPKKHLRQKR